MPLMRIRSVEIVFDDELSCTDTVLELSDGDSTRCVDSDRNDSVTLNAELSDDNSESLKENARPDDPIEVSNVQDLDTQVLSESFPVEDVSLSLLVSEMGDGRFTEDPGSCPVPLSCEDAPLSQSLDVINVETASTVPSTLEISDLSSIVDDERSRLFEYIDSDGDSSGGTARCGDERFQPLTPLASVSALSDDETVCDTSDLQYDSFVDLGKF